MAEECAFDEVADGLLFVFVELVYGFEVEVEAPPLRVAPSPAEKRSLAAIVIAVIFAFALTITAAPHATSLNVFADESGVAAQTDPTQAFVGFAFVGPNTTGGLFDDLVPCQATLVGARPPVDGQDLF